MNKEQLILKKVSEVSECQYKEDKIREILSDTFLTTDTFKNNKQDISDTLTDKTLFRGLKKQKTQKNEIDFSELGI